MIEAYQKFLSNYTNFEGRSRRSDYWYVVLANSLIGLVLSVLSYIPFINVLAAAVSVIFGLATLIPGIALVIRRLHDVNRSGWWYLIVLVPIVGFIVMLVWLTTDSYPEANCYGENPKGPFASDQ